MDAVPERKASRATASVPDTTYCQPCAENSKQILPEAFCPDCKEFLCSTCARVHRNMELTKSHVLQDMSSMPSSFRGAESWEENFKEKCQRHAKEFIKYFCPNHNELLCGDCVVEKMHRSCHIDKISQVAKRYKEGAEYNSLKTGLNQMVRDIGELFNKITASTKSVDEDGLTNINELREFRNEINQYFDKRESELLAEIEEKKRKSKSLLDEQKSKCQDMKTACDNFISNLQTQESNNIQLFISGRKALKELTSLQTTLNDVCNKSRVPRYQFRRDPSTEQLLASITAIGRLEKTDSASTSEQQNRQQELKQQQQQQATQAYSTPLKVPLLGSADLSLAKFSRQPDIQMKTTADTSNCSLTNVTLLPGGMLLLADSDNNSVKLLDTETSTVVSKVKLPGDPCDLCLLPGDRAAVTLPCELKIQFLSTKCNVSLQDIVEVGEECYGIDFYDDNLIVSFSYPGKVVMMDMKGKVNKSVDKDSSGKPLFRFPYYLTVTRESHRPSVYMSDTGTSIITMLSTSLQVLKIFKAAALINPRGLTAVGDTQLLVCGFGSNNIVLLDTSTGKMTQLLGKEEGIVSPYSAAYYSLNKWMFDTCNENDFVKVFKVK
ncbi:transcription intermediary factor 1-alpha-like [Mya arenaria]|uniref:transcription intermediary factor 1-alpha-like n=1 Tax=Mya arenaria TaxID=6604 RepID=UPI0022E3A2CF|nr:transcription intermediary factor 1-alpha-like [Mya arenaria]